MNHLHIYVGKIPTSNDGLYWVSFESDPKLKKNKANIYGRCLPCIQNLYEQLKAGKKEIALGYALQCWKVAAVVNNLEEALALLSEFEKTFTGEHVYGKLGSGRKDLTTKVVVFHGESEEERDCLKDTLTICLKKRGNMNPPLISRGCAVLHQELFGDWRTWQEVTPVVNEAKIPEMLERIKNILYRSAI